MRGFPLLLDRLPYMSLMDYFRVRNAEGRPAFSQEKSIETRP
jgi:hypothetical protein